MKIRLLIQSVGFAVAATLVSATSVALDARPRLLHAPVPRLPRAELMAEAEVELTIQINEKGNVINATVRRATNPRLAAPCVAAVRRWRYAPPRQDGAAVTATFIQPLHFGAGRMGTDDRPGFASAQVRHRVTPVVPAELSHLDAEITLELQVAADGRVREATILHSSADALNDAAIAAALNWAFTPATQQGEPVASTIFLPFHFHGDGTAPPAAATTARTRIGLSRPQT